MSDDRPDSEIVRASWDDPRQFGEIFKRHYPTVYGFVVKAVGPSDGPDLAAEVFVRALKVRHRFDVAYTSARPWLIGIAANLIAGHYRGKARESRAFRRVHGAEGAISVFEEDAVRRVDAVAVGPQVAHAMALLRREEAEVVCLFALGDLSYKEISQVLKISEGTVRSRLSRARARLRNLLAESGESIRDDRDE